MFYRSSTEDRIRVPDFFLQSIFGDLVVIKETGSKPFWGGAASVAPTTSGQDFNPLSFTDQK